MDFRYFRITYGLPNYRSAEIATVAVSNNGLSTLEMKKVAIDKLHKYLGMEVKILDCYKLPSNYKAQDSCIIK